MKDQKNSNNKSEIDFTSGSSFKKAVRKTKWKQFILYIVISVLTICVFVFLIHSGSQYLINKKIEKEESQESLLSKGEYPQGAAISSTKTRYYHNMFDVVAKTTIYKKIGNREIVWNTVRKNYPAIGDIEVIDRGEKLSGNHKINEKAQRVVRYNQLNNERKIDFYYPGLSYDYLPQELGVATGLNKNTLVEVALSFNEPMTLTELGDTLGIENVDWLWVNTSKKEEATKLKKKQNEDRLKILAGEDAYGFIVSKEYPYSKSKKENITINGAVVSGTPNELERFQKLEFVRSSVIGVTIDKY